MDFLFLWYRLYIIHAVFRGQNRRADNIPGEKNYFQKAEGQKSESQWLEDTPIKDRLNYLFFSIIVKV